MPLIGNLNFNIDFDDLENSFRKIPKDILDKIYVNYAFYKKLVSFDGILSSVNEKYIYENYNFTLPTQRTIKTLTDNYPISEQQCHIKFGAYGIELIVIVADIHYNEEDVTKAMKQMGWFVSGTNQIIENGRVWKIINFDPRYELNINNEIRSHRYLFHITPSKNKLSIYTNGFVPKSINNLYNYPPRVYFLLGDITEEEVMNVGDMLSITNKNSNGKYIIFCIDISKIPEDINFYYDPNLEHSIYIEQHLTSDCIIYETERIFINRKG